MSEPRPTDPAVDAPKDGGARDEADAPLELEDSRHGSSTHPVDASEESPAGQSPSASPSGSSADGGRSTSGFETLLGKVVIDRGLATTDELDMCQGIIADFASEDEPRTLGDVLVENEYLTRRQVDRLRTEFEAERTTQQIPGYRIKRKLGSGAMATVYLARQLSLDRLVAIKVLPKKFSSNAKFIERFYKEGRAAAKLNDPNIVAAYDVGQAGEHHYFVMEYVDGHTVHELTEKRKRVPEDEAVDIIRQVASALKHAHEAGFIHRDIKPKNIMISSTGTVKLADLGLARAISDKEAAEQEAGRAYGTPYYISPEQIRGERQIGPQADIYGLGATFYHMVTGRVPYSGKSPSEVMHKHLKTELVPPDHVNNEISAGCAQVIEMMLAKSRKDRYRNADDLLEDLDLIASGQKPHFAASHLDLTSIVTEIQTGPAVPVTAPASTSGPAAPDMTLFYTVIVIMAISLLANFALVAALVAG